MQNKLISIVTPVYNRAYCINKLYDSLVAQNCNDFVWVIVDDGSTDNIDSLISSYIEDNKISIKYLKKINGGKHTALNLAIENVDTKYIFIVDSDDWLELNAIEIIKAYDEKYKNSKIAGFSFLRRYPNGEINVSTGRNCDFISSYNRVRIYENRIGDMAEVYLSEILKKFKFPEYKNEKFIGEDVVWIKIGKEYDLVFSNEIIYISDYLKDGLTSNRRRLNILSCNGAYTRASLFLTVKMKFKEKIKVLLQLIVYGKFCKFKYKKIIYDSKCFFLGTLLYIPGCIIYKIWKKKYGCE